MNTLLIQRVLAEPQQFQQMKKEDLRALTPLILIPVLIVNQEMVVRLGAVSRVGHARLIFERFGKFWGTFSVIDLFILNFLTIVTEFIGFSMALNYFGVSPLISAPIGVAGLIAITVTGSFRRWESVMWVCCLTSLLTRPIWSVTRKIGMFTLRAYLLIAVILLVIKTVQLATEH